MIKKKENRQENHHLSRNQVDLVELSYLCVVLLLLLHAGGRLVPAGTTNPPGSGGLTGNSAINTNSAAARRGNRRLTRNESRYHSGEYILDRICPEARQIRR